MSGTNDPVPPDAALQAPAAWPNKRGEPETQPAGDSSTGPPLIEGPAQTRLTLEPRTAADPQSFNPCSRLCGVGTCPVRTSWHPIGARLLKGRCTTSWLFC